MEKFQKRNCPLELDTNTEKSFIDIIKIRDIITTNINFNKNNKKNVLEDKIMKNIIGKGISGKFYFYFSWGYLYFSAGYFFCGKIFFPFFNELNITKFILCRDVLYL
jgi:hypothetical protein